MTFQIAKVKTPPIGRLVRTFMCDENGSTAIEYGLIAGILAVALVSSLISLQNVLLDDYYEPVVAAYPG